MNRDWSAWWAGGWVRRPGSCPELCCACCAAHGTWLWAAGGGQRQGPRNDCHRPSITRSLRNLACRQEGAARMVQYKASHYWVGGCKQGVLSSEVAVAPAGAPTAKARQKGWAAAERATGCGAAAQRSTLCVQQAVSACVGWPVGMRIKGGRQATAARTPRAEREREGAGGYKKRRRRWPAKWYKHGRWNAARTVAVAAMLLWQPAAGLPGRLPQACAPASQAGRLQASRCHMTRASSAPRAALRPRSAAVRGGRLGQHAQHVAGCGAGARGQRLQFQLQVPLHAIGAAGAQGDAGARAQLQRLLHVVGCEGVELRALRPREGVGRGGSACGRVEGWGWLAGARRRVGAQAAGGAGAGRTWRKAQPAELDTGLQPVSWRQPSVKACARRGSSQGTIMRACGGGGSGQRADVDRGLHGLGAPACSPAVPPMYNQACRAGAPLLRLAPRRPLSAELKRRVAPASTASRTPRLLRNAGRGHHSGSSWRDPGTRWR